MFDIQVEDLGINFFVFFVVKYIWKEGRGKGMDVHQFPSFLYPLFYQHGISRVVNGL
jgi:hypothetical protein